MAGLSTRTNCGDGDDGRPPEPEIHHAREHVQIGAVELHEDAERCHDPDRREHPHSPRSVEGEHAVGRVRARDQQEDRRVIPPLPSSELLRRPRATVIGRADPEHGDEGERIDADRDAGAPCRCNGDEEESGWASHHEREPVDPTPSPRARHPGDLGDPLPLTEFWMDGHRRSRIGVRPAAELDGSTREAAGFARGLPRLSCGVSSPRGRCRRGRPSRRCY